MNKKIITIISILASCVLFVLSASAIDLGGSMAGDAATKAGYSKSTSETTFSQNIGTVIKAALSMVGVIFLTLMVYAGYLWMTARGQEEEIDKAQKIITAAIIGLVIVVGAYSITSFVIPRILSSATGQ